MYDSDRLIREPIVILAAPRSGSSVLFAAISSHPDLWSLYRESNRLLEGPYHPKRRGWTDNRLTADDLDPERRSALLTSFYEEAGNVELLPFGQHLPIGGRGRERVSRTIATITRPLKHPPIRIVEKSPKNTLRISFLRALFPDARFLHLVRDPRSNIASLYRAWCTPDRYKTYPLPPGFTIEGYSGDAWSFMLQPGWRSMNGRTLMDVCADQWRACNQACLDELGALGDRATLVRYEDLIADPVAVLRTIASWAHLDPRPFDRFGAGLPTVQAPTPPDTSKWMTLRDEIERVLPSVDRVARALGYVTGP